jgi:hypothetical protein
MLAACAIASIQITSFLDVEVEFGEERALSKSKKVWP